MTIDPVRLTDLADPTFSPEIRAIFDGMAAMAEGLDFDPDTLRAAASAEIGLDDFGEPTYEEPLRVLVEAVKASPIVSPVGRVVTHALLVQLLRNRLLLTDLLRRHPEIHDIRIEAPIVICGLPRTGTTHLHNLLGADPALRSLPYWESLEPVPMPGEAGLEPDPRLARTEAALRFVNEAMPHFVRMHEMTTDHVHEEIQLLAIDFSTMLFETTTLLPEYRDHYLSRDQRPHYQFMATVLKALQFQRGGRRWVLKSPQHLEQFGPLVDTFPDATFVVTHRDPVAVVSSMATMAAYSARMNHDPMDPVRFGHYWTDRLEMMLRACVRDRDLLGSRSLDVRFEDFMADDIAMVRRIYDLADQPFGEAPLAAMEAYMADHPRGRYGRVDYRPEDLGLDPDELRERFAFYTDRFLTE